jgi:hypothetical protein
LAARFRIVEQASPDRLACLFLLRDWFKEKLPNTTFLMKTQQD